LAAFSIWDRQLSISEWYSAVAETKQRLTAMSAPQKIRNWYIAEGDSITASYTLPQGESFAYRMVPELFVDEYLGHVNFGVGGAGLSTIQNRLPQVLARIAEVQAGGGIPVVSVLIGRNNNGTLITNADVDAYWVQLSAYYDAIKATGAKLIAITCLPSGTAATNGGPSGSWETARNYLNSLIRAGSSHYDALADFGNSSISIMGDVATCENVTYYAPDGVHPYPAGHAILAGIIKPIIQSFL
jgi:lysophospholipase L1-like esterase